MVCFTGVTVIGQELGFPNGLPQIIAGYADWTDTERTNEMFKVNSRRMLVIKGNLGDSITFKRHWNGNGSVIIQYRRANDERVYDWHNVSEKDFTKSLASGKFFLFWHAYLADSIPIMLQRVIDRWNAL